MVDLFSIFNLYCIIVNNLITNLIQLSSIYLDLIEVCPRNLHLIELLLLV